MAYSLVGWSNNNPPAINQDNLNHMDEGIAQNDKAAAELEGKLNYADKLIASPSFDIVFSEYDVINFLINSSNKWSAGTDTTGNSILIPINGTEYIELTGGTNGSLYAFLTDSENIVDGAFAHLSAGTGRKTVANGTKKLEKVPSDARFICLLNKDNSGNDRLPSRMTINNNIFNSLLYGSNLTNVNLDSGVTYATSGNPGDVVDLTQIARSGYYSKVIECQEGDAFVITGSSTSVNAARPYCFINSNNQIIQVAENSLIANALLLKVPENTAKAVFNFNGDCSVYYIKGYSISDVYRIWEKQNNGEMVWFPNPMVTYLDNTIYSTQYPRRAHSLLFKAVVPTKLQFDGIPDENHMYIYYCSTLNQNISGTRRIDVVNGVEYTIAPGYYYRALLQDDGTNPAWEVTSITVKKNGSGATPPAPVENDYYDLIVFAGQSNMAGRGITSEEHPETYPDADDGVGYEFRAISSPNTLYEIAEPFGLNENKTGGLNDGSNKTGGSVVSFANAYYKYGGVPIIAVSASEGATDLQEWLEGYSSNTGRLYDACQRLQSAVNYCSMNDIKIRHKFVVWLQGETDAVNIDNQLYTITDYVNYWEQIQTAFKYYGAEKLLVIRIGKRGGPGGADTGNTMYDPVIEKQTELCRTDNDLVMICTDLAGMRARGYMKDQSHYYQVAYNEFGTYAGINAAIFANQGKEPTMYDPFYDNLYYSKKN